MSAQLAFTGIELLIQLIDRAAAASDIIKKARSEGRDVSAEELAQLRAHTQASLNNLDAAIEKAREEGR